MFFSVYFEGGGSGRRGNGAHDHGKELEKFKGHFELQK
jgi:hypothetical protein